MPRLRQPVETELAAICEEHNGILRPEDVVAFAKSEATALHGYFTWKDDKAAHQYRLLQARALIRVQVRIIPQVAKREPIYVSLRDDRVNPGGGYRPLVKVLGEKDLREKLLADAFAELEHFQRKYKELEELAHVFAAVDDAIAAA